MATSLLSRSLKRTSFGALLGSVVLLLTPAGKAAVINDGTTADDLVRMANATNVLEEVFGPANSTLTPIEGVLTAAQEGYALPPLRTTWFPLFSAPTNGAYRVAADFRPLEARSACRGGVMGWLNTARSNGIVFQVVPAGAESGFRVATVDFLAEDPNVNESTANLYQLDGTPATASYGSAWSELGPDYVATNFATFELTFAAPTAADTNVVSNATARVTARVFQAAGSTTNPIGTTIELLTDLPLPANSVHALGYFAVYAFDFEFGIIGDLDNLVADSVGIRPNVPPTVQITNPAPGTVFPAGGSITLEAEANDSDGSVSAVEFFAGTTALGTVSSPPFRVDWPNVAAGNYTLTARARDNRGGTTTSAGVPIEVNAPPTIQITNPTPGASFQAPATIVLEADAQDSDGSVASVSYFAGATLIGTATVTPYSLTWSDVPAGNYSLTARATDNRGLAATSTPVTLTVTGSSGTTPTLTTTYTPSGILLAWGVTGFQLQYKLDLGAASWTDWAQDTRTLTQITVPYSTGIQFFRLAGTSTGVEPTLTIQVANGQVTVSWPAGISGYRLQAKDDLNAAWSDVPTTGNTHSAPVSAGNRFYRLINP